MLARALRDAAADFLPDQLAYLAATRKFEDPVRDAMAWRLHLQLLERGLTVSREFPMSRLPTAPPQTRARADIAILHGIDMTAVVELKALYTFDVHRPKKRNEYRKLVAADLARVALHSPTAEAFAVALTTHVAGDVRADLVDVVKYAAGVRSAIKMHDSAEALRTSALPLWRSTLDELGAPVEHVEFGKGAVWDLDVVVDAWLVGPVPQPELAASI